MTTVRSLHNEAMELAHQAKFARDMGDDESAIDFAKQALVLERRAAEMVPDTREAEPTRSIMYRGAASLAYQANDFQEALRLIGKGISGHPPTWVQDELIELFEKVKFEANLERRQAVLSDSDLEMSLFGAAVSFGMVLYDEMKSRLEVVGNLIDRTIERLAHRAYRRGGPASKETRIYDQMVGALPGSYIVRFRLIEPSKAIQLPLGMPTSSDIIREILSGVELLNGLHERELRERISDENYYSNFVNATKAIAPDGQQISFVGFTSRGRSVKLERRQTELSVVNPPPKVSLSEVERGKPISVVGVLNFANARRRSASENDLNRDIIGLTTDEGVDFDIILDAGMDDIVNSLWKHEVLVRGIRIGRSKKIYPTEILPHHSPPKQVSFEGVSNFKDG